MRAHLKDFAGSNKNSLRGQKQKSEMASALAGNNKNVSVKPTK